MGALSRWAVRRPWWAIGAYLLMAVVIGILGSRLGGTLNDSFSLPDTESKQATDLLAKLPASQADSVNAITVNVVWSPDSGAATDPAVAAQVVPVLTGIAELDGVACVSNPYDPKGQGLGANCPEPRQPDFSQLPPEVAQKVQAELPAAQAANSPFSPDGTVARATITFDVQDPGDVPVATAKTIIEDVKALNAEDGLQAGASGNVLDFVGVEPPSSEAIGMLIALIILLIAFGSIIAAGLPLLTAGFGVGLGASLLLWIANFADVATFAPTLAAMIGLGVGIDYSLFVINRFRQAVHAGHDPKKAALESVNTSGRAVVFAATTVVIALLGLFLMGINFFNGLAMAAAGTVILVMLSAVWLLPALLSLMGSNAITPASGLIARGLRRIKLGALAVPLEWLYSHTRESKYAQEWHPEGGRWAHYARLLQKRPIIPALVSLGLVLLLAVPALSLRLGFPDDSGRPEGSYSRVAYDLTTQGWGAGSNGTFLVAAQLPEKGDAEALGALVTALEQTPGVQVVTPSSDWLTLYTLQVADQDVVAIPVQPETGPQEEATTDLLDRLRNETIPAVEQATGIEAYVGGVTAITADFSQVLRDAMPLFLAVVVGLGFLMLMVLFRAPLVSLTAVVTSLLSFAASTGVTVAVFQWGWLNDVLGVTGTGPIFPFLPVMVFAILFGLSMDYQVFLVSRMQEEWARTKDNATAVRRGLAGSGKVVLIAALIMFSVFAAFIPTPTNEIKLFGVALASAVLVDAFLIRLVFVPSFMSLLGKVNWWLPGWLDRILPHFEVEGSDEIADDEPDAVGEPEQVGSR